MRVSHSGKAAQITLQLPRLSRQRRRDVRYGDGGSKAPVLGVKKNDALCDRFKLSQALHSPLLMIPVMEQPKVSSKRSRSLPSVGIKRPAEFRCPSNLKVSHDFYTNQSKEGLQNKGSSASAMRQRVKSLIQKRVQNFARWNDLLAQHNLKLPDLNYLDQHIPALSFSSHEPTQFLGLPTLQKRRQQQKPEGRLGSQIIAQSTQSSLCKRNVKELLQRTCEKCQCKEGAEKDAEAEDTGLPSLLCECGTQTNGLPSMLGAEIRITAYNANMMNWMTKQASRSVSLSSVHVHQPHSLPSLQSHIESQTETKDECHTQSPSKFGAENHRPSDYSLDMLPGNFAGCKPPRNRIIVSLPRFLPEAL